MIADIKIKIFSSLIKINFNEFGFYRFTSLFKFMIFKRMINLLIEQCNLLSIRLIITALFASHHSILKLFQVILFVIKRSINVYF
ncbi:hypothetical protein EF513_00310 [Rickettsiales endosymbiont of Stachyamoeba lipophora]|nr:hypothetical protein EF513_00310 [Rickettsiales endosymbiont of Stachyamoeba lipophora]